MKARSNNYQSINYNLLCPELRDLNALHPHYSGLKCGMFCFIYRFQKATCELGCVEFVGIVFVIPWNDSI